MAQIVLARACEVKMGSLALASISRAVVKAESGCSSVAMAQIVLARSCALKLLSSV